MVVKKALIKVRRILKLPGKHIFPSAHKMRGSQRHIL
jgi:hypothetical protein